jgi:arylsulfatase A-like enzyme
MTERNIALIVLDSVRKDFFDDHAPRLQAMADVNFSQCRTASSWSVPSHASIMTGELPHRHGIHTHSRTYDDTTRADTFLGELDHRAIGASANVYASSTFGFDGLFDEYSDIAPHRRFPEGMDMEMFIQDREETGLVRYTEFLRAAAGHEAPLKSLANGALFKLNDVLRRAPVPKLLDDGANVVCRGALSKARASSEPFFLFTNFMDAHGPVHHVFGYDPEMHSAPNDWTSFAFDDIDINRGDPDDYRRDLTYHRELYTAAIDYLDRKVASFVERLQSETDRETTVIVTADHGENLTYPEDDELIGHMSSLSEALLHVPMCVINPPPGMDTQYDRRFTHLDLGELLVEIARGESDPSPRFRERVPAELVGMSTGGPDESDDDYEFWDRMIRCVYRGDEKFVWDSIGGKYRETIPLDSRSARESRDEVEAIPGWATELFDPPIQEYKPEARAADRRVDVDDATASRLEELGYI